MFEANKEMRITEESPCRGWYLCRQQVIVEWVWISLNSQKKGPPCHDFRLKILLPCYRIQNRSCLNYLITIYVFFGSDRSPRRGDLLSVRLSVCGQPENLPSYNLLQHLECSRMSQNVPECSRMFQKVPECSRMHAECSRMHSECIRNAFKMHLECSRMNHNVPECSRMFQNAPECLQNVPECVQNVPECVQNVPGCMQNVPE